MRIFKDIFSKIGIHFMQGWAATTRYGVTRKRREKRSKKYGRAIQKEPKDKLCLFTLDLKGTWGQSNIFCIKRSFFILKQYDINQKFHKITCKPQLAYFVCSFVVMTSLALIQSLIHQIFVTSQVTEKWLKT